MFPSQKDTITCKSTCLKKSLFQLDYTWSFERRENWLSWLENWCTILCSALQEKFSKEVQDASGIICISQTTGERFPCDIRNLELFGLWHTKTHTRESWDLQAKKSCNFHLSNLGEDEGRAFFGTLDQIRSCSNLARVDYLPAPGTQIFSFWDNPLLIQHKLWFFK